ncbi:MAG: cytochrome C [Flavobacteriales bacterium]|nr:MAG: cytochrome C [Flavobacteriales bacterium]
MKKTRTTFAVLMLGVMIFSCSQQQEEKVDEIVITEAPIQAKGMSLDKRISLDLNEMQKNHQLKNMRSHLEAIQTILTLIAKDNYDEASEVAYTKLGSTTEMKLMCASFGNERFENLGLDFHKSADEMSEVFKLKDKDESLKAISNTMNYCVSCHSTFRQ